MSLGNMKKRGKFKYHDNQRLTIYLPNYTGLISQEYLREWNDWLEV